MGGRGGGGGGVGTLSKITQDYPPPPTVYKQFINNPCTRMLSTLMPRTLSSVLLSTLCVCLCAYALWSLEITMDHNIYHIP